MLNPYLSNERSSLYVPDAEIQEEQKESIAPQYLSKANLLGSSDSTPLPDTTCAGSAIYIATQECDACQTYIDMLDGKQDVLTAGSGITIEDNVISAEGQAYNDFVGATDSSDGVHGLVPAPETDISLPDTGMFLRNDGGWSLISAKEVYAEYGSETPDVNSWLESLEDFKVDKVPGKGLSTNDFTTTEKNKLSGIEAGAEVNVNADWDATSGDAQILHKPTIPSITNASVTLAAADWANDEQTVNVSGVTASNNVIVTYDPSSKDDYTSAGIYCSSQGDGTLTFKCSLTPSADITVNVLILA